MKPDYTLYLVTDRRILRAGTLPGAVEQAISGGCTMVQLREKEASAREFYHQAKAVREITRQSHTPLIINDRADIALAVGADGVHIGQSDLPARAARRILGPNLLLGVSVTCVDEALRAVADGADYLGVGSIFATGTKADAVHVPLETLWDIRRAVRVPVVVIGGIGKENAALFRPMGIDGLSVVSAVLAQPDIARAAAELKALFLGAET